MPRRERWKFPLLLLVAGVHLWLGWKLAIYRPSQLRSPTAPRPSVVEPEVLMVLSFPARKRAPAASRHPANTTPARELVRHAGQGAAPALSVGGEVATHAADAPLALEFRPAPNAMPIFAAPDPLRRRKALAFQTTRFDHAWMSDGDLKHVIARRSKIASALLGALGALREPCTDRQREQYDVDCVPDQYQHPATAR